MAARDFYNAGYGGGGQSGHNRVESQPPTLPPLSINRYSSLAVEPQSYESPISPSNDRTPLYQTQRTRSDESESRFYGAGTGGRTDDPRHFSDEIPLRENPQRYSSDPHQYSSDKKSQKKPITSPEEAGLPLPAASRSRKKRPREPEKKEPFFSRKSPWVCYIMTLIQLTVFIAEIVRSSILTGSPIEIHPQVNPMLGPSFPILINMGARYVPCMKSIKDILPDRTVSIDSGWPCPHRTTSNLTDPSNQCPLSELCGFQTLGNTPNQWYRFITPIFLHAGIVHIGFNMLLQLTLGREMERVIGSIRFLLVYLCSGIFGFVLGGNFAANGIAAMGASGSLFGIIAINLLDLLYTWGERESPGKELAFIMLDIIISFVLGLLPGLDNFSHIGGFLMGLVMGICLLHSPNALRARASRSPSDNTVSTKRSSKKTESFKSFAKEPVGFFKGRKPFWWAWWLVRAGALLGVLVCFVVLLNNFYVNHSTCSWCKYLTCLVSLNNRNDSSKG